MAAYAQTVTCILSNVRFMGETNSKSKEKNKLECNNE